MANKAQLAESLLEKGFEEKDFEGMTNAEMEALLETEPEVKETKIEKPSIEDIPVVDPPKVKVVEKLPEFEKVRVLETFTDLYIGGEYYSGTKKEFGEYPRYVASILRNTGLVI